MENVHLEDARGSLRFSPRSTVFVAGAAFLLIAALSLILWVLMRYALAHFSIQGVRFEARPDINIVAIICGLMILVIAEVFREGTRLDEEQSLTI